LFEIPLKVNWKFMEMLSKNCFSKRCALFIIRPIGHNFSILKFKFILWKPRREKTWSRSNPIRETPSDSAQFNVICENPIRSDQWNSVISSVYAFSRDAPSLSPTIQHSCFTSSVVEHFLIHWLQTSILLGQNLWCGIVTN